MLACNKKDTTWCHQAPGGRTSYGLESRQGTTPLNCTFKAVVHKTSYRRNSLVTDLYVLGGERILIVMITTDVCNHLRALQNERRGEMYAPRVQNLSC